MIEEREVLLPCRVSGVPTPTVVWTKDNETISPDDVHYRILRSNWLAIPIVRLVVTIDSKISNNEGHSMCQGHDGLTAAMFI